VQTLACPIGAAAPAGAPAGAGAAPPDPAVLAALARQTLGLPSPVIRSSPARNALQLTNLPAWLWINPAEWVPPSKTPTVPGSGLRQRECPGPARLREARQPVAGPLQRRDNAVLP
jgi:hypothetical protein